MTPSSPSSAMRRRKTRSREAPTDLFARSLFVPEVEVPMWPSLGGQVCQFIEELLVHGPGDVLGEPVELLDEMRVFIWRAYEVYPQGHPLAGRRRFKRAAISRLKGWAKTELMAFIAIVELDPDGPVRCDGFDANGEPVGRGVRDPYIPLVATAEEQSDELAFGAARSILEHCDLGNRYDVGVEQITPRDAPGKMVSLANAPNSRDGARTTFQGFDETHKFIREALKAGHATMLKNALKRKAADPWSLEATTMYEPGADSIAERTHAYAVDVARGAISDPSLYFDHRQASLIWDLNSRAQLRKAIEEAAGDAAEYADLDAIANSYQDPTTDRGEFRRYWLNQRWKGQGRWIAPEAAERLVAPRRRPAKGKSRRVVLAFDGSATRDSTALVGATVEARPHVFVVEAWEKPRSLGRAEWRVPRSQVDAAIEQALVDYEVVELAPDPPGWRREIEEWEQMYGDLVVRFDTNQPSRMGPAADTFFQAVKDATISLDGSPAMMTHLGNCYKAVRRGYTVPVKSSDDSPDRIDVAVAAVVATSRAIWRYLNPPVKTTWRMAK